MNKIGDENFDPPQAKILFLGKKRGDGNFDPPSPQAKIQFLGKNGGNPQNQQKINQVWLSSNFQDQNPKSKIMLY